MPYKQIPLTCPDCGVEFTGTTEKRVQRDLRCALRYFAAWADLQHAMRQLGLPQLQAVREFVATVR